jgi:hypothetical protein
MDTAAGWLAVFLGVYNLVRWWARRSYLQRQHERDEFRRHRLQRREPREYQAPDPNFIFDDNPPPPAPNEPPQN